jgi:hypothetical protein
MKHLTLLCVGVLAVSVPAGGHTLDEYVQALKVGVTSDRVSFFLDLTPGANIAAEVVRRVDTNDDGVFAREEAEAYGRAVLAELVATLSGSAVALTLTRVELPGADELRGGNGVIRIEASARGTGRPGRHELVVRNTHLPRISVYLANALMPETTGVIIHRQTRDSNQQTFRLDYETRGATAIGSASLWLLAASITCMLHVRLRRSAGSPAAR